jgi:predicted enzyme related to lactoylglutathione lyase
MKRNPVGWFEIYVQDMSRAKAFYEAVLGLKLDKLDSVQDVSELWAWPGSPDSPGATGALVKMPGGPAGGGASSIVYFTCEDCAIEVARAAAHGGQVKKAKTSIGPYGFIALVEDPEGNVIGLHSLR